MTSEMLRTRIPRPENSLQSLLWHEAHPTFRFALPRLIDEGEPGEMTAGPRA